MALLLPDKIRERWKDLVDELSAYYKTPVRLAVFRRQFENVHHRLGSDPATFAMELGILALRGFSDMKEKARDLMVRNKFIACIMIVCMYRRAGSAGSTTCVRMHACMYVLCMYVRYVRPTPKALSTPPSGLYSSSVISHPKGLSKVMFSCTPLKRSAPSPTSSPDSPTTIPPTPKRPRGNLP